MQGNPHTVLQRTLAANAAFSTLGAIAFLGWSGPLERLVGLPAAELRATGVGLVGFVALILVALAGRGTMRGHRLALAFVVAAMDVIWVLATPLQLAKLRPAGAFAFGTIALVVAVLAWFQIGSLIRIRARGRRGSVST